MGCFYKFQNICFSFFVFCYLLFIEVLLDFIMAAAQDQTKLRKRLEALLKLPDNQTCADCRKRGS